MLEAKGAVQNGPSSKAAGREEPEAYKGIR